MLTRMVHTAALLALLPANALACPFCRSSNGAPNWVKTAIFTDEFWFHLAAISGPFLLTLLIAALMQVRLSILSR